MAAGPQHEAQRHRVGCQALARVSQSAVSRTFNARRQRFEETGRNKVTVGGSRPWGYWLNALARSSSPPGAAGSSHCDELPRKPVLPTGDETVAETARKQGYHVPG